MIVRAPDFIRESTGGSFEAQDGGLDAVGQVHHRHSCVLPQEAPVTSCLYHIMEDVNCIVWDVCVCVCVCARVRA